jgi:hypothetical protein
MRFSFLGRFGNEVGSLAGRCLGSENRPDGGQEKAPGRPSAAGAIRSIYYVGNILCNPTYQEECFAGSMQAAVNRHNLPVGSIYAGLGASYRHPMHPPLIRLMRRSISNTTPSPRRARCKWRRALCPLSEPSERPFFHQRPAGKSSASRTGPRRSRL